MSGDFLHPGNGGVNQVEDSVVTGEKLTCRLVDLDVATDNLYLVAEKEVAENVDKFNRKMTEFYERAIGEPSVYRQMSQSKVALNLIKPGFIVAAKVGANWERARVEQVLGQEEKPPSELLLLDSGKLVTLKHFRLQPLHKDFAQQPAKAFKVSLGRMDGLYDNYVQVFGRLSRSTWNVAVMRNVKKLLQGKKFEIRFVKKVAPGEDDKRQGRVDDGERIWAVEIVGLEGTPEVVAGEGDGVGTIEEQAVAKTFRFEENEM